MDVRFISNVTKEYPNNMYKIMIYKEPRPVIIPEHHPKREPRADSNFEPKSSSIQRTKTLIKDIVLCNDFELFCTFTFDPKKSNRMSYGECFGKMSRWLHHQKDINPDFKYLVIPEQHKNGAWHFHALISNYSGSLKNSHHKSSTGRTVYNMTSYRSGFTTAVKIDNKDAVAHYVTKYITKDFIKMFNKRRFFCSRNLKRPVKVVNSPVFRNSLPIFRQKTYSGTDYDFYLVQGF